MDAITKFEEDKQMGVIFDVLKSLGLERDLAIVGFGPWGVEFECIITTLLPEEVKILAHKLSGNSCWPDLSYALPIESKFTLKCCEAV